MVGAYNEYSRLIYNQKTNLELLSFDVPKTDKKMPIAFFVYFSIYADFTRIIINNVNLLGLYVVRIRCWIEILKSRDVVSRNKIVFEFVDPVFVLAVNLPYVIRSRYIFSIAHLSHHANQAIYKKWNAQDLPPDEKIDYNCAYRLCKKWSIRDELFKSLNELFGTNHKQKTFNFRTSYHHHIPSLETIGYAIYPKREFLNDGRTSFSLQVNEPADLDKICTELECEFEKAKKVFSYFRILLEEHIKKFSDLEEV